MAFAQPIDRGNEFRASARQAKLARNQQRTWFPLRTWVLRTMVGGRGKSDAPFATGASRCDGTPCTLARAAPRGAHRGQRGLETSPRPSIGSPRSHPMFSHPPSARIGKWCWSSSSCSHIRGCVQEGSRAGCSLGQQTQPPRAVRFPWHRRAHTHCRASWGLRVPRKMPVSTRGRCMRGRTRPKTGLTFLHAGESVLWQRLHEYWWSGGFHARVWVVRQRVVFNVRISDSPV